MSRALKLQQRAARVGFDWTEPADIIAKLREETDELEVEIKNGATAADAMEDELGDVFFVLVNLARRLHIDPERALRRTNRKFEIRFGSIESALTAQGRTLEEASLDEMENLWQEAKRKEKG
jgi:ATP diphosphatase